jgi:hypothetical protein
MRKMSDIELIPSEDTIEKIIEALKVKDRERLIQILYDEGDKRENIRFSTLEIELLKIRNNLIYNGELSNFVDIISRCPVSLGYARPIDLLNMLLSLMRCVDCSLTLLME